MTKKGFLKHATHPTWVPTGLPPLGKRKRYRLVLVLVLVFLVFGSIYIHIHFFQKRMFMNGLLEVKLLKIKMLKMYK